MNIEILVGILAVIIGFIGMNYVFIVFLKLKGAMKKAYGIMAFGILSGYLVLVTVVYQDFGKLPFIEDRLLIKILLVIATLFIGFGSMKLSKVLSYIPEGYFKAINKFK